MSEEMSKLERTLQRVTALPQATAAPSAPQPEADPHEAALRQTWLSFGRLLEAAEAAAPAQRPLTLPNYPRTVSGPTGRRRWLLATISVVVAASLLLAAVAAMRWNRAGQQPIAVAPPHKTIPAPAVVVPSRASVAHQPSAQAKTSVWDDTIDTQIGQVGRQIALVEHDWRAQADIVDMVQYRLKSVEQEVGEGKF